MPCPACFWVSAMETAPSIAFRRRMLAQGLGGDALLLHNPAPQLKNVSRARHANRLRVLNQHHVLGVAANHLARYLVDRLTRVRDHEVFAGDLADPQGII